MPQYYIWTIGCQMNKAETQRIASYLELCGYQATPMPQNADLIILNTCVVRQSAEDKVIGALGYLKGIRNGNARSSILVTGCFVNSNTDELKRRFPHVALFFKPGSYVELFEWTHTQGMPAPEVSICSLSPKYATTSSFVPIIQGCNNFCSYCVVPYRRGREKSRPIEEIVQEVGGLVKYGTKEVTLLGQNVNSYGNDLPTQSDLSDLLAELNNIDGLFRIRFLTNNPKDMSQKLIESIASLDKVCEHITLPFQAGDNDILRAMRRDYTIEKYQKLVDAIRLYIPEIALSTDVIVGFPGETEKQFNRTLSLLKEISFDTVHVAAYSPRPDTIASREYEDNIPLESKKERLNRIEALQARIAGKINSCFEGSSVEVLVEGQKREKWYGRTRSDKLVFFGDSNDFIGQLVHVTINKTSPWALQGKLKNDIPA